MEQYGFFFDQSRCSGCHTCAVACKNWNRLPPGPIKFLKIYEYEKGVFPNLRLHFQWIPCYHCEDPSCLSQCPTEAIYKEDSFGAVLIDAEKCSGCRICYEVCPYGAPVFESDDLEAKAQKCTMCIDRLRMGDLPVCVLSCHNRALDFKPLKELFRIYGQRRDLEDLPSSKTTKPAVVFKPHSPKKQIIPYNVERARELLMRRDPLPLTFHSIFDLIEITPGTIGRSELVIKHKSAEELMRYTRNDEG